MGKITRRCDCLKAALPEGLSWDEAKRKGWKKLATKAGQQYLCPKCAAAKLQIE